MLHIPAPHPPVLENSRTYQLTLRSMSGRPSRLRLSIGDRSIGIYVEGYGDALSADGHGEPVIFSVEDGIPKIYVWDDINNEEPSHAILLSGAAEANRLPDADQPEGAS